MADYSNIHKAIDKAKSNAVKVEADVDSMSWILFSDHHRGRGDGADDFKKCEATYTKALKYYSKKDFVLGLLGDVEEFWENPLEVVIKRYNHVLELEQAFFKKDKLYRLWGNHDDIWQTPKYIKKLLGNIFPRINVHEGLDLELTDAGVHVGNILLIHGHQGTIESDRFAWLSKFMVRVIWRNIQRLFKIKLSTPSTSTELRSAHDKAMYSWARAKEDQLLICGHTHQPVFMSMTHIDYLVSELQGLQIKFNKTEAGPAAEEIRMVMNQKNDQLKKIRKEGTSIMDGAINFKPVYFNTGCCSFSDGDITGIEISDGKIKLIKWEEHCKEPIVLNEVNLKYLFYMGEDI